jgi:hypothetical protein
MCLPNIVELMKQRRKGLSGHRTFMGGFGNYMLCRSEKLNARENNTQVMDFNSMEEISWED